MTIRIVILVILAAGCSNSSSSGSGPPDGAHWPGPREATEAAECVSGTIDGSPDQQCIAAWTCRTHGAIALACGNNMSETGVVTCVCLREGTAPIVLSSVPTSCTDVTVVTDFVKANCGWSWL